jgi:hypothetical protein
MKPDWNDHPGLAEKIALAMAEAIRRDADTMYSTLPPLPSLSATYDLCGVMFPPGQFSVQQCTLPRGHVGEHGNNIKGL